MNEIEEFEALSVAYLDPFISQHPFFRIDVYERIGDSLLRRAFRETSQTHGLHKKRGAKILWGSKNLGSVEVEFASSHEFTLGDQKQLEILALQFAPLFGWSDAPWTARLRALKKLWELKAKNSECDWVGIYRKSGRDPESLLLSLFIGAPTVHTKIPVSEGICGAAIREERTLNIPNVQADPRFIACSLSTQSELVVPVRNRNGSIVAEIDIDSDRADAFSDTLTAKVEACADKLSEIPDLFA